MGDVNPLRYFTLRVTIASIGELGLIGTDKVL